MVVVVEVVVVVVVVVVVEVGIVVEVVVVVVVVVVVIVELVVELVVEIVLVVSSGFCSKGSNSSSCSCCIRSRISRQCNSNYIGSSSYYIGSSFSKSS